MFTLQSSVKNIISKSCIKQKKYYARKKKFQLPEEVIVIIREANHGDELS